MSEASLEVSVVVPTFREAANLPLLIPQIADELARAGLTGEIIIVDDDSRDGTDEACDRLAHRYPVRLLTRYEKRGLATAVLDGLDLARGQILVVMDADLSHPARAIGDLVEMGSRPTVDFVIGSRYVAGAGIDKSWSRFRRINSRLATMLARGLTSARDPMAGFFALKQSTYRLARNLRPLGYKVGLELIVRCRCRRVVEVPIAFHDRVRGESKLSATQQWLYLRHLGRLYAAKCVDLVRSAVCSVSQAQQPTNTVASDADRPSSEHRRAA